MSSFLPAALELNNPKFLDERVKASLTRQGRKSSAHAPRGGQLMRFRHYSLRTEEAYAGWSRRRGFPGEYLRCGNDYSRVVTTSLESTGLASAERNSRT
jgi:hypothetical protein